MQRGFTLIELLVALAAASILSLSALQVYSQNHRLSLRLAASYRQGASELLHRTYEAIPYRNCATPNRSGSACARDSIPFK